MNTITAVSLAAVSLAIQENERMEQQRKAKLSDRIRPNVEAAPWVIAEVKKLEAEIERLHGLLALPQGDNTHQCKLCLFKYTPLDGQSEDCPRCGHDGRTPE